MNISLPSTWTLTANEEFVAGGRQFEECSRFAPMSGELAGDRETMIGHLDVALRDFVAAAIEHHQVVAVLYLRGLSPAEMAALWDKFAPPSYANRWIFWYEPGCSHFQIHLDTTVLQHMRLFLGAAYGCKISIWKSGLDMPSLDRMSFESTQLAWSEGNLQVRNWLSNNERCLGLVTVGPDVDELEITADKALL